MIDIADKVYSQNVYCKDCEYSSDLSMRFLTCKCSQDGKTHYYKYFCDLGVKQTTIDFEKNEGATDEKCER